MEAIIMRKLAVAMAVCTFLILLPYPVLAADIADADIILMARIVWGEARGESYMGKVAVAEVILTRARDDGLTVKEVSKAKGQFSIGSRYNKDCVEAVKSAVAGLSFVEGARWFFSNDPELVKSDWVQNSTAPDDGNDYLVPSIFKDAQFIRRIGGHDFYGPADSGLSDRHTSGRVNQFGDSGANVAAIQDMLLSLGYDLGECGADGEYGEATLRAVIRFQRACGLDTDGVVGERTLSALKGCCAQIEKKR